MVIGVTTCFLRVQAGCSPKPAVAAAAPRAQVLHSQSLGHNQPLRRCHAHACPAASAPAACAPPEHTSCPARGSLALRPALLRGAEKAGAALPPLLRWSRVKALEAGARRGAEALGPAARAGAAGPGGADH